MVSHIHCSFLILPYKTCKGLELMYAIQRSLVREPPKAVRLGDNEFPTCTSNVLIPTYTSRSSWLLLFLNEINSDQEGQGLYFWRMPRAVLANDLILKLSVVCLSPRAVTEMPVNKLRSKEMKAFINILFKQALLIFLKRFKLSRIPRGLYYLGWVTSSSVIKFFMFNNIVLIEVYSCPNN